MQNIEEKISNLVEDYIVNLGYELYDVEYIKQGKEYYLRIYIDNAQGINLEDCEKVSNIISDLLDKEDIIKEQYYLEVSSPGIERILKKDKHLKNNILKEVEISLYQKQNNQKHYTGILKDFDNDNIYLEINNELAKFERKNISQIKTIYKWN